MGLLAGPGRLVRPRARGGRRPRREHLEGPPPSPRGEQGSVYPAAWGPPASMAWPTTAAWHPVLPPGEPGDAAAGAEPGGEGVTEGHKGRSAAACEPGPSAGFRVETVHMLTPRGSGSPVAWGPGSTARGACSPPDAPRTRRDIPFTSR